VVSGGGEKGDMEGERDGRERDGRRERGVCVSVGERGCGRKEKSSVNDPT